MSLPHSVSMGGKDGTGGRERGREGEGGEGLLRSNCAPATTSTADVSEFLITAEIILIFATQFLPAAAAHPPPPSGTF